MRSCGFERIEQGRVESQRLLVPEPVHLTAVEAVTVLDQAEDARASSAWRSSRSAATRSSVTSTPAMLA